MSERWRRRAGSTSCAERRAYRRATGDRPWGGIVDLPEGFAVMMYAVVIITGPLFLLATPVLVVGVALGALAFVREGWPEALHGHEPEELVVLFAFPLAIAGLAIGFYSAGAIGDEMVWARALLSILLWANVGRGAWLVQRADPRWMVPAAAAAISYSLSAFCWFGAMLFLDGGPGIG